MEIQFKPQLKPGTSKTALVFLLAYHKCFTGHRFVWSTGESVTRQSFEPARLGKTIRMLIDMAEAACDSLKREGQPINNQSLKHRIELIRSRIGWIETELSVWDGSKVLSYPIPEEI